MPAVIETRGEAYTQIVVPELSPSVVEALDCAILPPLLRTQSAPCGLVEVSSVTMAAGKSRAVEVLAEELKGCVTPQLERWQQNPFLENPQKRFASEIWFLQAKAEDLSGIVRYPLETLVVQDQPPEGDHLFAPVDQALGTLDEDELNLYQWLYRTLVPQLFRPDLIVHLDCTMPEIFRRIRERGREFEQAQGQRIRALAHLTDRWVGNGAWGEIPTLTVNSEELNFDTDSLGKQKLTEMVVNKLREVNPEKFAHLELPVAQ